MTTPNNDPILHTEIYKGRQVTVVQRPRTVSQWSAWGARIEVLLDEKDYTYQGGTFPTETSVRRPVEQDWVFEPKSDADVAASLKKAIKKGRAWVDASIADAEILPSLENCIAYLPRATKARLVCTGSAPSDFEVGDLVWFHSRGNYRQGRIEKVGKTNVGVAYVTEVGGNITRKNFKPGAVGFSVEEV